MKPNIGKGDKGTTNLVSGKADKSSPLIGLIGSVDYLNSLVGFARSFNVDPQIDEVLEDIQTDLFVIGSELAGIKQERITREDVKKLEGYILTFEKELPKLNKFIYPTGNKTAGILHVARSFCRKVEAEAFSVSKKENISSDLLAYLNRLSDVLFTLARIANKRSEIEEKTWP